MHIQVGNQYCVCTCYLYHLFKELGHYFSISLESLCSNNIKFLKSSSQIGQQTIKLKLHVDFKQ